MRFYVLFFPLRRASRDIFAHGAKLQHVEHAVWRVPEDLKVFLKERPGAKQALSRMVRGENVHIEVFELDEEEAGAADAAANDANGGSGRPPEVVGGGHVAVGGGAGAGRQTELVGSDKTTGKGGERSFLMEVAVRLCTASASVRACVSLFVMWLEAAAAPFSAKSRLRKQRSVSGQRHLQMCVDLSTLRWSWDDYILIHEILPNGICVDSSAEDLSGAERHGRAGSVPRRSRVTSVESAISAGSAITNAVSIGSSDATGEASLAITVDYKSHGARMRIRVTFDSADAWRTWLKGLSVLHAATLDEDAHKVRESTSSDSSRPRMSPSCALMQSSRVLICRGLLVHAGRMASIGLPACPHGQPRPCRGSQTATPRALPQHRPL